MFDARIVEEVWLGLVHRCAASPDKSEVKRLVMVDRDDMPAALTALCAHLNLRPEALNALAAGEAVVVPREATEDMVLQGWLTLPRQRPDTGAARACFRNMLAASPYAPTVKGGGDD